MFQELFGARYFGFIASSYAITFFVLLLMVIWVLVTYSRRKADLSKLENAGLRRAASKAQDDMNG